MTLIRHTGKRIKGRNSSRLPSGQSPATSIDSALSRAGAKDSAFPLDGPETLPSHLSPQAVAQVEGLRRGAVPAEHHAPAVVPEGAYPYEDVPADEALAALDGEPWPPVANLGDPLDPSADVLATESTLRTPVGDSIPAPASEPEPEPVIPDEYRVPLDSRAVLYTEPGWTRAVTAARLRSGEWDDLAAEFDGAYSREAAGREASFRHVRRTITEGWREICVHERQPDRLVPGWGQIRNLTRLPVDMVVADGDSETLLAVFGDLIAAAKGAEARAYRRRPSFTPHPNPTRPQPVLREGRSGTHRRVA